MASSIETTSTTTTLKNNGNTYMSVDTNDVVTMNVASLNGGQLGGNRNLIINGDFNIWQRGTAETALSQNYKADRWGKMQYQSALHSRQAFVASGTHPENSQYVLRASGDATTALSRIQTAQGVESVNCIPLRGKTITLSLYLRCVSATMPTSSLSNLNVVVGSTAATADGSFLTTTYVAGGNASVVIAQGSLPTTWTKYTVTYTVPTNTNNIAAYVGFSGNVDAGTGDWYEISQVQIEEGTVATPFEHRSYGTELALCQRYYAVDYDGSYRTYVSNVIRFVQAHPVVMRATPTLTVTYTVSSGFGSHSASANSHFFKWDAQYPGGGGGVMDLSALLAVSSAEL